MRFLNLLLSLLSRWRYENMCHAHSLNAVWAWCFDWPLHITKLPGQRNPPLAQRGMITRITKLWSSSTGQRLRICRSWPFFCLFDCIHRATYGQLGLATSYIKDFSQVRFPLKKVSCSIHTFISNGVSLFISCAHASDFRSMLPDGWHATDHWQHSLSLSNQAVPAEDQTWKR